MLSEDIEAVDSVMNDSGIWSHKRQAWQRIKTELVEAQKTHTNKPIMQVCPKCGSKVMVSERGYDCENLSCNYGGSGKPA